jgi:hypothetical protein
VLKSCPAELGSYIILAGVAMTSIDWSALVKSASNMERETAAVTGSASHHALGKRRFRLAKSSDS